MLPGAVIILFRIRNIFLILLISVSLACADTASYYDFSGGLNDKSSNILIADNEAAAIQNIAFTEPGAITKRSGYTTVITTPVVTGFPVTSIFDYQQNDGDAYTIATSSSYIKKLNTAGNNWDTLLSTMTTVTGTDFYDFCVFPDTSSTCIITNGKDKIQKYVGGTKTLDLGTGADPDDWRPNMAKVGEVWDYRLWFGNIIDANGGVADSVVPNRLRYSSDVGATAIEGADAWPALWYFDISDTMITGLSKLNDRLVIFGPNSISTLGGNVSTTTNSYFLKKVVDGKGTLSNRTIKPIDNLLIFQDKSGDVYTFDGGGVTLVSGKIQTTINGLNKSALAIACAAVYPKYHQYWLSVPTGASTTNNLILVYDYLTNTWTKYTGINAADLAIVEVSKIQYLYSGDTSSGGLVFKQDYGDSDNGSSITAYYTTKYFSAGNPASEKQFDSAYLTCVQSGKYNLSVTGMLDFGKLQTSDTVNLWNGAATWDNGLWGNATWSSDNTVVTAKLSLNKAGNFIAFKFYNDQADQKFVIYGFNLKYFPIETR